MPTREREVFSVVASILGTEVDTMRGESLSKQLQKYSSLWGSGTRRTAGKHCTYLRTACASRGSDGAR